MKLKFFKYHGTGNDFILIDNRNNLCTLQTGQIEKLCDRRFGIGADGLMFLNIAAEHDFEMKYYNSNGLEGTMCGNGGRCITAFSKSLGIINNNARFLAIDGIHESKIISDNEIESYVSLKIQDVENVEKGEDYFFLNTGSPQYVKFVDDIEKINVVNEGKRIRWAEKFQPEGTNVNFMEFIEGYLFVRTFERGVENETLSCGTGVTASSLVAAILKSKNSGYFDIKTKGGDLKVHFKKNDNKFTDIWLEGPAVKVFEGIVEI